MTMTRQSGVMLAKAAAKHLSAFSAVWLLIVPSVVVAAATMALASGHSQQEPITPLEAAPDLDPAKVALGRQLFDDPILSGKGKLACSSCHDLNAGGTVNLKRTVGYDGKMHRFNAPAIFNVANNYRLGWRGNFTSLAAQNEAVLLDPNLMASQWGPLVAKLKVSDAYSAQFRQIYNRDAERDELLDALVTFERSLSTPNSRFDRYLRGESNAISSQEKEGYLLFKSYGCASCHQGSNVGGNLFEKFGVFGDVQQNGPSDNDGDLGRWTITHDDEDKGVFRVPSLRNVEMTSPYFHDGRVASLPKAVEIMSRMQLGQVMPQDDVDAIVAFLKTLTGEYNGRLLDAPSPSGPQ
jgi:cytochrome c peroxidase